MDPDRRHGRPVFCAAGAFRPGARRRLQLGSPPRCGGTRPLLTRGGGAGTDRRVVRRSGKRWAGRSW